MPMRSVSMYAILLFLSCSFRSICASGDRLVPGEPLSPGNTLVSNDGTFALGFFSPSKSTKKHYYVGIWYNNIPQRTVVWVANRAAPITDLLSAMLTLHSSTNLVLSQDNGRVLWSSNNSVAISFSPGTTVSVEAILENTGNLMLRSLGYSTTLWQSFDHPSDTLLPGMKLRISHKMHPIQHLIAWNGLHDPSPGVFSYGADPNNILQQFIWNGTTPHHRSPVWTNYFLLGSNVDNLHSTIYMVVHRGADDEIYMSFGMPLDTFSLLTRMKINYSGKVNILSWNSNMSVWTGLDTQPAHQCNEYGYCGPYGYCDNTGTAPTCKCLDGFEPNDDEGWVNGKFSQGCRQKTVLRCGDGFMTLPHMKAPDHFIFLQNKSFDECVAECRSNCSCVAYAHANMSTKDINGDDTRCLIWTGKMIDMERYSQGGENLYIRINKPSGHMTKTKTLEIALPTVTGFLAFICIGIICIYWFRDKQGSTEMRNTMMLGDMSIASEVTGESVDLSLYSFGEIVTATNNFSRSTILGQGGFGTVYKGTLGGKETAVKRLCIGSGQGAVEFKNEVLLIAKLEHRNLVKLLGYCIHAHERVLIYEYLPNKSLDAFLFNAARKSLLDWPTRFKIIKGVARGLVYLHRDSTLTVIHRDLKASNILLDAEMSPKISDFGLARTFSDNQEQSSTSRVIGTFGYMAPEYALEGIISVKSDVYSFGVLLLEIVSGSKVSVTGPDVIGSSRNLIAYAWSLWKNGNMRNLVDPSIVESCSLDESLRCIHIGLLLVQDRPNARPLMPWVVSSLDNKDIELPQPREPLYVARRHYETGEAGTRESYVNDMTLGTLEGR